MARLDRSPSLPLADICEQVFTQSRVSTVVDWKTVVLSIYHEEEGYAWDNVEGQIHCAYTEISILRSFPTHITFLELVHYPMLRDRHVSDLVRFYPNIKTLLLRHAPGLTNDSVKCLADGLPNLTHLQMGSCYHLDDEALMYLAEKRIIDVGIRSLCMTGLGFIRRETLHQFLNVHRRLTTHR